MVRARKVVSGRHGDPRGSGPRVWVHVARRMVLSSISRGAERAALLRAAGLEEAQLADPDARMPLLSLYELVEAAARATGQGCWGLLLARELQVEDLDALGFLLVNGPTLGVALEQLLRYQRVWNEGERYTLEHKQGRVVLGYHPYGPERPAHHQLAQLSLADMLVNGGRLVGGLPEPRVCFRGAPAARPEEYTRVLGVEPEFHAPGDELWLPGEVLERPLSGADMGLHRFFSRYAEGLLERVPTSPPTLAERVRALLVELLPGGEAGLEPLARRLGMSARTLQRRLSEDGTSLQAELESLRRQQSRALLESGMSIAEVAWLLGYSEPSAFHHAFKRWTGLPPEAWRTRER